jgi:hypothetical protein
MPKCREETARQIVCRGHVRSVANIFGRIVVPFPSTSNNPIMNLKKLLLVIAFTAYHQFATAEDATFTCNTPKHHILITKISATDRYRYQSWNKPKKITEIPDMDINDGNSETDGTAPCENTSYKFKKGNVEFIVDDNTSCTEEQPPKNATGSLWVYINGDMKSHLWCTK